ncbi:hypothetical protein GW17_00052998 [Ensete ventricosum]|nr:hypothetical protein GW17_00052998 [Ensete ventricosum]
MIGQGQVHVSNGCGWKLARSALGAHEGIGSLLGWRKGVHQKKIEICRKIVEGSRKACRDLSIGPRFGRCSGISPKFTRRFIEGSEKLVGNTSGDRWKKTERLAARMLEATGLAGIRS